VSPAEDFINSAWVLCWIWFKPKVSG